jgi:hypothetical protein
MNGHGSGKRGRGGASDSERDEGAESDGQGEDDDEWRASDGEERGRGAGGARRSGGAKKIRLAPEVEGDIPTTSAGLEQRPEQPPLPMKPAPEKKFVSSSSPLFRTSVSFLGKSTNDKLIRFNCVLLLYADVPARFVRSSFRAQL